MSEAQFEELMEEMRKHTELLQDIYDDIKNKKDYSDDLESIKKLLKHMDSSLGYIENNTTKD